MECTIQQEASCGITVRTCLVIHPWICPSDSSSWLIIRHMEGLVCTINHSCLILFSLENSFCLFVVFMLSYILLGSNRWHSSLSNSIFWRRSMSKMLRPHSIHFFYAGANIPVWFISCVENKFLLSWNWQGRAGRQRGSEADSKMNRGGSKQFVSMQVAVVVSAAVHSGWWNVSPLCETWLLQSQRRLRLWLVAVLVRRWGQPDKQTTSSSSF